MNIKKAIASQKIAARKSLAEIKLLNNKDQEKLTNVIDNENKFIKYDFSKISTIEELLSVIHSLRHKGLTKAGKYTRCKLCKNIIAELLVNRPEKTIDILPKFGNLLDILKNEVLEEKKEIQNKRLPSQNDLTRWALKDAVLAFYQGLGFPENTVIVSDRYDDRLIPELAPDFDVIAKIWMQKLDELKRRNDKFTLNIEEYDKAEDDLKDGMRGSAFEKQLDRYREEFMSKLPR